MNAADFTEAVRACCWSPTDWIGVQMSMRLQMRTSVLQ